MKNIFTLITTLGFILFTFIGLQSFGQGSDSAASVDRTPPTISIGIGTLSYFGELNNQNSLNSPLTSQIAYNLSFRQHINYFLEFDLTGWGGNISANERSLVRNLNFSSNLFGASVGVSYNFANFLKPDRILEPIIGVGIEFISFNSRTDLFNENNIRYNYWDDGSIRDMPQNSPDAEQSVRIQRDYYYESDIRTSEMYNLDEYNSYTLAFPVTIGANMFITDKWSFRAAMTYHFTMTDLLDGVDPNSGNFVGDSKNDNLLYTSVSLSYNFRHKNKFDDAMDDFMDYDPYGDEDGDGVNDFDDICPDTPSGIAVDAFGCPLDGDNDGVANHLDDELMSSPKAQVDTLGVTIPVADVELAYAKFYDTTGIYSPIESETYTMQIIANKVQRKGNVSDVKYAVTIGEFEGDIPAELVNDILSVPDVNTHDQNGKVIVTVGTYATIAEAKARQAELEQNGITTTDITAIDKDGNLRSVTGETAEFEASEWDDSYAKGELIYRVQVGAFKGPADQDYFKGLPNLIQVTSDDGYTRYYTGSHTSYEAAAKQKIDILLEGYNGAFVVALRKGNKVPIEKRNDASDKLSEVDDIKPLRADQLANLKFKVQLSSHKSAIRTDILEQYMELGQVEQINGEDGHIKYAAGTFKTYEEASSFSEELTNKGFEGTFVIAVYYGKLVPVQLAKEMLEISK